MTSYLGKLICKLPKAIGGGHRRGKRVPGLPIEYPLGAPFVQYECRRCKATWTRKVVVRKVKVKTP